MVNGEWSMVNGESAISYLRPPTSDLQLPASDPRLPTSNFRPPLAKFFQQIYAQHFPAPACKKAGNGLGFLLMYSKTVPGLILDIY
jgi:hypothetical protein